MMYFHVKTREEAFEAAKICRDGDVFCIYVDHDAMAIFTNDLLKEINQVLKPRKLMYEHGRHGFQAAPLRLEV